MHIEILQLVEGARKASGLVVIIDVFRAFSTACYVMANGANKIIPVGEVEEALHLKTENPSWILMGERNEQMPAGFHYGNSPTYIKDVDFTGKTIVQTTSAGTRGIVNATNASEILSGSFVNAQAIANYIVNIKPKQVSLVCMGYATEYPTEEDTFCAQYIKNLILGEKSELEGMVKQIRQTSAKRLFDPKNQQHSPSSDFDLCMSVNRFDFVLRLNKGSLPCFEKW
jgi:2-phosphosulfolactate phosphatase